MITVHADDYAVSLHTSQDIVKLIRAGKLDSTSVIPNMSCFEESTDLLKQAMEQSERQVHLAIHINLMEGHCIADKSEVSELVDEEGYFYRSWSELLLASYSRKRDQIQKQLETEIYAQIMRVMATFPGGMAFRMDSHQHTHMIPVVWDALARVLRENRIPFDRIRIPAEPIRPFMRERKLLLTYKPVNWIKNMVLQMLAVRAGRHSADLYSDKVLFWGLLMTSHMDEERVTRLYPHFKQYADKKHKDIEMVFHPGTMLASENGREYTKQSFLKDHMSANRELEFQSINLLPR